MRVFGLLPCIVFLVAGGLGIMLFWALLAALNNRGRSRTARPPGRCTHGDCNHLNNPRARYCGNCGRSLA